MIIKDKLDSISKLQKNPFDKERLYLFEIEIIENQINVLGYIDITDLCEKSMDSNRIIIKKFTVIAIINVIKKNNIDFCLVHRHPQNKNGSQVAFSLKDYIFMYKFVYLADKEAFKKRIVFGVFDNKDFVLGIYKKGVFKNAKYSNT